MAGCYAFRLEPVYADAEFSPLQALQPYRGVGRACRQTKDSARPTEPRRRPGPLAFRPSRTEVPASPATPADADLAGCPLTRPAGCHLTGTQYLGIISFMDCSMCPKPIPEPRLLVVPYTLTCSPECSRERIRWRSRERAKLQRQRRKAANAAKREAAEQKA